MLAVIRVLTTTDEELLASHGRIISERFKIPTRNCCIPDQINELYGPMDHLQTKGKV